MTTNNNAASCNAKSITTRIETRLLFLDRFLVRLVATLNPLQQGLKHSDGDVCLGALVVATLNPLQQGLKLMLPEWRCDQRLKLQR